MSLYVIALLGKPRRLATLAHRINRFQVPDPVMVQVWYGQNAPDMAFGPTTYDRLVFSTVDEGNYIVIPDTKKNRSMFWQVT